MITLLICLLVSAYGFLHFAMSVQKHHMEVYKPLGKIVPLTRQEFRVFQLIGWLCMGLSLWPAISHWGVGIGIMAWLMILAVSATAIAAILSYRMNWVQIAWQWLGIGGKIALPKYK